jgi:hypothetical protein
MYISRRWQHVIVFQAFRQAALTYNMDNFMETTKTAGHRPELERLRGLHAALMDGMDGHLVTAPIDFEEPGKRILDSGTADGAILYPTLRT